MKYLVKEKGTGRVTQMIEENTKAHIICSSITWVEISSALSRRRNRGLSERSFEAAYREFMNALTSRVMRMEISALLLEPARLLTVKHRLRSLDSIQLATANLARALLQVRGEKMLFICSDQDLIAAAKLEQHDTENPAEFLE